MERGLTAKLEAMGSVLANKDSKRLVIRIAVLLLAAAFALQIAMYLNMAWFKQAIVNRDYAFAGYLLRHDPSLSTELPSMFKADKTSEDAELGRALLAASGYHNGLHPSFHPDVYAWYKKSAAAALAAALILGMLLMAVVSRFLHKQEAEVERMRQEVQRVNDGAIKVRLNDSEEGGLSRLAASLNLLIASLQTHIEKEKHNRSILKQLLTEISHQLKTPLSALVMYNEIMREERTDNSVIDRFLRKSDRELARMNGLIANLLKLARLDAGVIKLEKSDCPLHEWIGRVADRFKVRLEQEGKRLAVSAGEAVVYRCDEGWLTEAVSNFIQNAAEHTAEGDRIDICLEQTPLMIQITVRDTGEGIHADDLHHIFKPFFRSSRSRSKTGTGIGLTLAQRIAHLHGGFLSVDSIAGQGAAFTLHLPKTYKPVSDHSPGSKLGLLS